MSRGPDVTSNREQNDSVFHNFTYLIVFVGKAGKVVRKKMRARYDLGRM